MTKYTWLTLLGLASLLLAASLYFHSDAALRDPRLPPGGDFVLQSADGPVDSRALRDKVVLIYFGYTQCPDICPTSLSAGGKALQLLTAEERGRVQYLMVSVDPERDTLQQLKEYTAFFHPSMRGISGSPAEVAAVAKAYGAGYIKQAPKAEGQYSVDHTTTTHVVDRTGKLSAVLPMTATPEVIAATIRKLL